MSKPPPQELDALFFTEKAQMQGFQGLRTFEAAALHNPAWSNGPVLDANLPADERSWLNVFRKYNWCTFQRPILETSPGLAAAGFGPAVEWDVDNPVVWGALSPSIELANRIILQSFKTLWMQAFMTPANWVHEPRDIQDAQRKYPVQPNVTTTSFYPFPNQPNKTEAQCKQWFQELFAARKPLWHLRADTDDKRHVWSAATGIDRRVHTAAEEGNYVTHIAAIIDVEPLRALLNPNITPPARYLATVNLAITLCHELMIHKQSGQVSYGDELFYNGELMSELGHSFVQNFFGNAWAATVYAHPDLRQALHEMVDAFQPPLAGLGGPLKEHKAANFVARVTNHDVRQEVNAWQQYPWPGWHGALVDHEAITYSDHAKLLFYQSMAFLVDAALPPRDQEYGFQDPPLQPGPLESWRRSGNQRLPAGYDPVAFHDPFVPSNYSIPPRHQPNNLYATEVLARESNLNLAHRCFLMHAYCTLTTIPLVNAFHAQYNSHSQQLQGVRQYMAANPGVAQPLIPFTFQLPPYTEMGQFRGNNYNVLTFGDMRALNPLQKLQNMLPEGEDPLYRWLQTGQDTVLHQFAAQLARVTAIRRLEYFTLGRLYDLRLRESDVLVLVLCESEIEIFRLAEVMQALSMTAEEVGEEMEASAYGYILKKELSDYFYVVDADAQPLGRVAQWLREEDVAIRDGKEGRPHWITAAGLVFDLTDLEAEAMDSQATLIEALKSAPGSNPMPKVVFQNHDFDEALELIRPFRIGMTVPFGLSSTSESSRVIGEHEIGWSQFEETRQYVQIHDDVYDITDYGVWHPGGTTILTNAAGTNVTSLFEEHHSENGRAFLKEVQGLRVGRAVPSQSSSKELSGTQLCINDNVFDIASLQITDKELFVALKVYCGKKVTDETLVQGQNVESSEMHPLLLLYNTKQDLIVAKIQTVFDELPVMNESQLVRHSGAAFDQRGFAASYVAYDDAVFDVTTLMQFGPAAITDALARFVGSHIIRG
ncbi:hypothetical protein ACHAQH_008614 [Verticillium albo-atrum]